MSSTQSTSEINARLEMYRIKHEQKRKQRIEKLMKAVEKKDQKQ